MVTFIRQLVIINRGAAPGGDILHTADRLDRFEDDHFRFLLQTRLQVFVKRPFVIANGGPGFGDHLRSTREPKETLTYLANNCVGLTD